MRKYNPAYLAAAVAFALSGPAALAQTTGGTLSIAPVGTTSTTTTGTGATTGTASPAASTGGCVGTGGSTCTATTDSASASNSTLSTSTTPTPGVRSDSSASPPPSPSAGATGSAMGTHQTTVDPATTRPGSFEPGGAFGPAGTSAQGTTTVSSTLNGTNGAVLIPGDTGFAGNPSQQNIVIQQQPAPQPEIRTLSTPLLDHTAREAQSRETRRRNAKQEPRIIGIAPNTDRDLTHQMPDDRIIRY